MFNKVVSLEWIAGTCYAACSPDVADKTLCHAVQTVLRINRCEWIIRPSQHGCTIEMSPFMW